MTAAIDQSQNADKPGGDSSQPEQPLRIVVLSKDAAPVKPTVSFLVRRGVEVFSTANFQEAIDKLANDWTRFILVSVNFPHPKIDLIPQLLTQSFNAEVLVFAEGQDRKSSTRLTASKAKHVIFGTVSGPVVLMRINQIIKEAQQSEDSGDTEISRSSGASKSDPGSIHLRGEKAAHKKDEGLKSLMAALAETDTEEERQLKNLSNPVVIQKGNRGKAMLHVPPPTVAKKAKLRDAISNGQLKSSSGDSAEAAKSGAARVHTETEASKTGAAPELPAGTTASARDVGHSPSTSMSQRTIEILTNCMRAALDECCGPSKAERDTIKVCKTVSILVFYTKFFRGSVIIAIGRGGFDHKEMLKLIETEFVFQVIQSGADIEIGELEKYEISPIAPIGEAFSIAPTVVITRNEKLEVGMAAVDVIPEMPNVTETEDAMIAINPDTIEPEQNLEFELFLHLPKNNKYLKYVREGRAISVKQSNKLKAKADAAVYLTKGASDAFKHYASVRSLKKKISGKAS